MKTCDYRSFLRDALMRLFNFLLPESCLGCGKNGIMLCEPCVESIPPPAYSESKDMISLFDYRNRLIRKALWALKYRGGRRMGKILGRLMYAKATKVVKSGQIENNSNKAILIPIPLSKKRLRERGFNQSEILAEEMSYRDQGEKFTVETSVLYRTRDTGSQALIKDRKTRMNNVKGCFAVNNKNKILGKNIILIDDITTTGATLEEAKKVLVDNGAERVIAVTVGH